MERGVVFQNAESLIWKHHDDSEERFSSTNGRGSPLDFLAQASLAFHEKSEKTRQSKWVTTDSVLQQFLSISNSTTDVPSSPPLSSNTHTLYHSFIHLSDGREKITVVPGPAGASIRLHRGNGRLPPIDLSKPFAKKCRNRECNNLGGQLGKPRSIYCSKRCQSREQNLRQGRIKNIRSVSSHTVTVSIPNNVPVNSEASNGSNASSDHSPRSSPSPLSMDSDPPESPPMNNNASISASPPVSPVPLTTEGISPSPSPLNILSNSPFSSSLNLLAPSPLTLRLGMTPSPIMSPSPLTLSSGSSFSPIQMTSSIPTEPIYLPKPAPLSSAFSPAKQNGAQNNNANKVSNGTGDATPRKDNIDNLTLAPIRS